MVTSPEPRWRAELKELSEGTPARQRELRETLQRVSARILKEAAAADRAAEPSVRAMAKMGWTIPLWAPTGFTEVVVERVKPAELDEFFVRSYRANRYRVLREMLSRMKKNPALQQWWPLLQQCANVFRQHNYLVVVPSLLLVLEGVLLFYPGSAKRRARPTSVSKRRVTQSSWIWTNTWISIDTFLQKVFESRKFHGERPTMINRHWILHGRDETTWSESDCIRLFQAIDTVSFAINEAKQRSNEPA